MDKVEITALILQLCVNGASRRDLQSKADLQEDELDQYLDLLVSKNLINIGGIGKEKENKRKILPTERGVRFLDMYNAIRLKYLTMPARTKHN